MSYSRLRDGIAPGVVLAMMEADSGATGGVATEIPGGSVAGSTGGSGVVLALGVDGMMGRLTEWKFSGAVYEALRRWYGSAV